jgi:glycerol dehydrogenase
MAILHCFISPRRYAQGAGALAEAGTLIGPLGQHAFVLYDRAMRDLWAGELRPALAANCVSVCGAEGTRAGAATEIDRIANAARATRADIVVGMGGGTVIDIAKAVADDLNAALVIIPTLASTGAPVTAFSVVATDAGAPVRYHLHRRNADLVIVDTQVIADAPVRSFIAGIGNALATAFEARAAAQAYATTMAGGWQTAAAGALSRACWETLRQYSPEAIAAVRAHRVTDAVKKIVEANILLSGLGSESGGLAAAHAVRNGLTALPETQALWHGEKVAFGVLAALELEKASAQERRDVLNFCITIGLPTCFADLGVLDVTPVQMCAVAERAMAEGEPIYNEPCALSVAAVVEALRAADARCRAAKAVAPAA